jgi:hypothetical protein
LWTAPRVSSSRIMGGRRHRCAEADKQRDEAPGAHHALSRSPSTGLRRAGGFKGKHKWTHKHTHTKRRRGGSKVSFSDRSITTVHRPLSSCISDTHVRIKVVGYRGWLRNVRRCARVGHGITVWCDFVLTSLGSK